MFVAGSYLLYPFVEADTAPDSATRPHTKPGETAFSISKLLHHQEATSNKSMCFEPAMRPRKATCVIVTRERTPTPPTQDRSPSPPLKTRVSSRELKFGMERILSSDKSSEVSTTDNHPSRIADHPHTICPSFVPFTSPNPHELSANLAYSPTLCHCPYFPAANTSYHHNDHLLFGSAAQLAALQQSRICHPTVFHPQQVPAYNQVFTATPVPQPHVDSRQLQSNVVQSQSNTAKRKRSWSRAVFSNLQRKGLEKRFVIQKYITKPDRRQLAATLGLTDAQVKVWFQNRRMKWRHSKEYREELAKTNASNEDSSGETTVQSGTNEEKCSNGSSKAEHKVTSMLSSRSMKNASENTYKEIVETREGHGGI